MLFEVMLAIALFTGAAAFTLAAVQSVHRTLERSEKQQQAIDLARSRLAQLEAGLTTIGDLRGEAESDTAATLSPSEVDERSAPPPWRMEVGTARTEFTNLTLVELTVIENIAPNVEAAGANPMRYTLRQLVALREDAAADWEEDEPTNDLPDGPAPSTVQEGDER